MLWCVIVCGVGHVVVVVGVGGVLCGWGVLVHDDCGVWCVD